MAKTGPRLPTKASSKAKAKVRSKVPASSSSSSFTSPSSKTGTRKTLDKSKVVNTALKRTSNILQKKPSGKGLDNGKKRDNEKKGSKDDPVILVNRAPVLTLWMTVVLERLGHEQSAALTAARAIAGLCATAKGRSLGLIPPLGDATPEKLKARAKARAKTAELRQSVAEVSGIKVPLTSTPHGLCAVSSGRPLDPNSVASYLRSSFKHNLDACQAEMRHVAASVAPAVLRAQAMRMYEGFRPEWRGWGAKAELRLGAIRASLHQPAGRARS